MPVLQQSFIRKTNATIVELQEYLKEKESKQLEVDTTIYSIVHNILNTEKLLTKPFDFVYDYYFFTFMHSTQDVAPKMKKLFKDNNILYEDILTNMSCINAYMMHTYEYQKNVQGETIAIIEFLKSYVLFLGYLLDLLYPNKKILIGSKLYKFKDLEERNFNLNNIDKEAVSLVNAIIQSSINKEASDEEYRVSLTDAFIKSSIDKEVTDEEYMESVDNRKFSEMSKNYLKSTNQVNPKIKEIIACMSKRSGTLGLSNSIMYKRKYATIQIDHLMKTLLPTESDYYLKRYSEQLVTILNAMEEIEESEYNLELTTDFYRLLKKRAYLLPRNGVSLVSPNSVLELDLYERHHEGEHYLIVINNVDNFSLPTIINLTKEYVVHSGKWLYDICNYLYYFYKLDEQAEALLDKPFIKSPRMYISYDITNILESNRNIVQGTNKEVYSNFDVTVPYYWRYKGSTKAKKVDIQTFRNNTEEPSEVFVSAYKRKLPKGQRASKEAKDYGKRYEIELEENETLVKPFTRGAKSSI